MKLNFLKVVIPIVLVGLFVWALLVSIKSEPFVNSKVKSLKTPQQADVAIGYPLGNEKRIPAFNSEVQVISPFERAAVPIAHQFEHPKLKKDGSVHSCADGLVVYSGTPSEEWGNTVVLAHKTKSGQFILSYISGLTVITVSDSSLIARGESIGLVRMEGSAQSKYKFQLLESDGVVFNTAQSNYLNVAEFLSAYSPSISEEKSPLKILQEKKFNRIKSKSGVYR